MRCRVGGLSAFLVLALVAPARADDPCVAVAPVAELAAADVKGHRFKPEPANESVEEATLPGGYRLRIETSGCVDVIDKSYRLTVPGVRDLRSGAQAVLGLADQPALARTKLAEKWVQEALRLVAQGLRAPKRQEVICREVAYPVRNEEDASRTPTLRIVVNRKRHQVTVSVGTSL